MICVVIPYYQRTAGVLTRALESVFAQDIDEQVLILIVDDASPIPAATEIANLRPPARIDIQVVSQANAGPGAARNTGLGLVPTAAQIIAFLDSDDVWQPSHLARLRKAFDQGADLDLSNWEEMSGSSMLDSLLPTLAGESTVWPPGGDLYRYQGVLADRHLIQPFFYLSATAIRRETLGQVRFDETLRHAGEDFLYAFELAKARPSFWFSSAVTVLSREGVNIYRSVRWGTEASFRGLHDAIVSLRQALGTRGLAAVSLQSGRRQLQIYRTDFLLQALHCLRQGKTAPLRIALRVVLADPGVLLMLPAVSFDLLRRAMHRSAA